MNPRAHTPHPPIHTLTGRWIIERADRLAETTVAEKRAFVWVLTVRHADTGARDDARITGLERTTFRVGQELNGRIVEKWDGPVFQRDRPAVGPRRD
jgi:hypothetical protein